MLFYCPIACDIFIINNRGEEKSWFHSLPSEIQSELHPEDSFPIGIYEMHEFKERSGGDGVTYFVDCDFSSTLIPSQINRWHIVLKPDGTILSKEIISGTTERVTGR